MASSPSDVDECRYASVPAYDCYLKGRSCYHSNKPDDLDYAERMFLEALKLDPQLALAHAGLSDIHSTRYMAYYDRTVQRLSDAHREAVQALEMCSDLPEAHRSLGRYHMFAGDLVSAEEALLEAIRISPKYFVAFRTMAWLKEAQSDHESALLWAKKSLDIAPTDLETLLLLSLLYMDGRKYTLAMATLQRAIELGPDYGRAYYSLGGVYLKLGVLDLARDNFKLAIKYHGDPNACNDLGYVFMLTGDYENAISQLRHSIDEDCFPFTAYHYLGLLELIRNNPDEATTYFEKAIMCSQAHRESDPDNPTILAYETLALAALGRTSDLEERVKSLIDMAAHDGEVVWNIARCYSLVGNKEQAEEYIAQAVKTRAGPTQREIDMDPHFAITSE